MRRGRHDRSGGGGWGEGGRCSDLSGSALNGAAHDGVDAGFELLQVAIELVVELVNVGLNIFDGSESGFGSGLALLEGGLVMRKHGVVQLVRQHFDALHAVLGELGRGRGGLGGVRHFGDENGECGCRGRRGAHAISDRRRHRFNKRDRERERETEAQSGGCTRCFAC